MTSFVLVTPPSVEPVMLADAKLHARIDTTVDDTLVASLITAARQWAERYTARAFINQTWRMWIDNAPMQPNDWWDGERDGSIAGLNQMNHVQLPRPPLVSVNSVQVFDNTDTGTVWASTNYFVDNAREPGRLALRLGATWPIATRITNGLMIEYVAGYGSDGTSVPEPIKAAIRQLVSHWYEHRGEAVISGSGVSGRAGADMVPFVITTLLDPYRIQRLRV